MALTVAAPSSTRSKSSSSVRTTGGFCVRRTHTRVAMPSIPSPPTNTPRRSSPAGSGSSPPRTVTLPSGSTTSTARMCMAVTPSDRQCGSAGVGGDVPAHRAALLAGGIRGVVDAVRRPANRLRSAFSTPGSTQACRQSRSTERSAVHLRRDDHDRAVAVGTAPPASPVPEPRATKGTPWRAGGERRTPAPPPSMVGKTTTELRPSCSSRRAGRGSARWPRCAPGRDRARSAARRPALRRASRLDGQRSADPATALWCPDGQADVVPEDLPRVGRPSRIPRRTGRGSSTSRS